MVRGRGDGGVWGGGDGGVMGRGRGLNVLLCKIKYDVRYRDIE